MDRYHDKPNNSCEASYGNPIEPLTGAKRQDQSLGLSIGSLALSLGYDTRRHLPSAGQVPTFDVVPMPSFGDAWSNSIHHRLAFQYDGTGTLQSIQADRGAGRWIAFNRSGAAFLPDADTNDRVVATGSGWRYVDHAAQTIEVYDAIGVLNSLTTATGETHTFTYSDAATPVAVAPVAGLLIQVQDPYGRATRFTYEQPGGVVAPRVASITDANGRSTTVAYNANGYLSSLTWPDAAVRQFVYEAAGLPWALTGVIDETTQRLSTYSYDGQGRAAATQHTGGVNRYSVSYSSAPQWAITETYDSVAQVIWRDHNWQLASAPVMTLPNGSTSTLDATLVQGMPRLTSRSQPAGAGCAAATQYTAYDANGNATRSDNFNGQRSCHAYDTSRNLQTVAVEGLANTADCATVTPAAAALPTGSRKTGTDWHPDWRLKTREASPRKLTTWVYNGQPDPFNANATASCAPGTALLPDGKPIAVLCKRVEQTTTDANGSTGFAATVGHGVSGNASPATRTWAWTYNAQGQVLTEDGPRTDAVDTITYAYFSDTAFTGTDPNAVGHTVGDLQTITNALGRATNFTQYNKAGKLLQSIDPNGTTTTYTYDARQRLLTRTVSASGVASRITSYAYWPNGLLKSVSLPVGIVTTAAGTAGQATGRSYTYTYDAAQRLTDITSSTAEAVHYTLDNQGNVTREEWTNATANGAGTASLMRRQFDALGRLWKEIRTINGADATTEYGYDANGNPTTTQKPMVAAYGETTAPLETRRYNSLNQLNQIEDAISGSGAPTVLTPRADDQLAGLSAPNAAGSTYQLDAWGNVLQETSADRGTINQTFDEAGNLKTRATALGVTATYTYDALNRVTSVTYTKAGSPTETETTTWDSSTGGITCTQGIGRLCKLVDNSGTAYFAYDPFGNPIQQQSSEASLSQTNTFGFDGEDRLSAATTSASRALALVRDSEGRTTQVGGLVAGALTSLVNAASYTADGRQDKATLGNNLTVDRDFDASGLLTGIQEQAAPVDSGDVPTAPQWAMILLAGLLAWQMSKGRGGKHTVNLWLIAAAGTLWLIAIPTQAAETLHYDARGNIDSRTVDGNPSTYQYDKLDRVDAEAGKLTQGIGYDSNGNRLANSSNLYALVPGTNRIATRNGVAWAHDANGNVTTDQAIVGGSTVSRSYTYSLSDQLKTVSVGGVLKATYWHNAQRQRTRKTLTSPPQYTPATTLYRYDPNGHLFEEIAGSAFTGSTGSTIPANTSLITYVWKDEILAAVIYAPGTQSNPTSQERVVYIEVDHLNTPRKATDSTGKVVWTWESDAFGSSLPNEDPDGDGKKTVINLRFPGQYFDAESGLHYNWHRYYDPQTGRYTQPDPLGLAAGANPYAYVGNGPLGGVDPTGLFGWADMPTPPQSVVDFGAGMGDVILFGQGQRLRDMLNVGGVDRCSGAYSAGEWAGVAASFATGLAGGMKAAGTKGAGREFSHWIPNRMGGPRSTLNGNYVSTEVHALSDPYRYQFMPRDWKAANPMPSQLNQQWVRIPNVYKGAGAGAAYGKGGTMSNDCTCQ